jgi:hypothetical protein
MQNKEITLTVSGIELVFNVTTLAYNSYINDITMTNKVAPSSQFVNRTVTKESAQALADILNKHPGAALQIAGKLVEDFAPELEIEIKN